MIKMGQSKVKPDGKNIIEEVLFMDGVIQEDTIFSSTITANPEQPLEIYDSPNEHLSEPEIYAWDISVILAASHFL